MKAIVLALAIIGLTAATPMATNAPLGTPKIEFKEMMYDFGDIKEGDQAKHEFVFTNTGDAPLILTDVKPSCNCTTPEWPRQPIMPGKSDKIIAIFDSKGRPGEFNKSIEVFSNATKEPIIITMKGNAKPKLDADPEGPKFE